MSITIITKNSAAAGAVPSSSQLVKGELAVNVTDRKLYTLDASNNIVLLSSGEITLTTTGTSGAATLVSNALNIPIYGDGTVKSVSVATANGFAGTVATSTTTPAITLTTSVTGIIKGNSGGLFAATAGSDYQAPVSLTTLNTSGAATFASNILNIPQYQGVVTLTTTGTTGAATFASNTLNIPQYQGSITLTTTGTTGVATLVGNTLNIPTYSTYTAATPSAIGAVYGSTGTGATANTALGNTVAVNSTATSSVGIGVAATVSASVASATAVGANTSVTASNGTAIGGGAISVGTGTAIGSSANVQGTGGVAVGYSADIVSTGTSAIAIGANSSVSASNGVAIGSGATIGASSSNAIAIGASATVAATTTGSIAIGGSATSGLYAVALGYFTDATTTYGIAIGYSASAQGADGIAIGRSNVANNARSILIGSQINDSAAALPMIVLSTQSTAFAPANEGVFINGMRTTSNAASYGVGSIQCNASTKELFYCTESFSAYGVNFQRQSGSTAFTAATTVTAAQLATGILQCSGSTTYALTMPTGASLDTQFPLLLTNSISNISFDVSVINNSTTVAITITAGVGCTLATGSNSIPASTSALFRFRRTGTSAYTYYRIA